MRSKPTSAIRSFHIASRAMAPWTSPSSQSRPTISPNTRTGAPSAPASITRCSDAGREAVLVEPGPGRERSEGLPPRRGGGDGRRREARRGRGPWPAGLHERLAVLVGGDHDGPALLERCRRRRSARAGPRRPGRGRRSPPHGHAVPRTVRSPTPRVCASPTRKATLRGRGFLSGVQDAGQLLDAVDEPGARARPGGVGVDRVHRYAGRQDAARDQLVGQRLRSRPVEAAGRHDDHLGVGRVDLLPGDPPRLLARQCRAGARRRRPRSSPAPSGRARTAGRSTPAASPAAGRGRPRVVVPLTGAPAARPPARSASASWPVALPRVPIESNTSSIVCGSMVSTSAVQPRWASASSTTDTSTAQTAHRSWVTTRSASRPDRAPSSRW